MRQLGDIVADIRAAAREGTVVISTNATVVPAELEYIVDYLRETKLRADAVLPPETILALPDMRRQSLDAAIAYAHATGAAFDPTSLIDTADIMYRWLTRR